MTTLDLLDRLIAFPTVSDRPNAALVGWARGTLSAAGVHVEVHPGTAEGKLNLYARVGGAEGGALLSAHSDVVPAEGQPWTRPPFRLTRDGGRLYGRGTADMKGFVACAMTAMIEAARRPPARPLHFALACDEEVGCRGAPLLIAALKAAGVRPGFAVIGEPTAMRVAVGHKGKRAFRALCRGVAGHSAAAPLALNALHLGAAFIGALRAEQDRLAAGGARDAAYEVPHTTVHAGLMTGGTALNIVPDRCEIAFEIRAVEGDDPDAILARLRAAAGRIAAETGRPEAAVEIVAEGGYPGLATDPDAPVAAHVAALAGEPEPIKVAFGTEAGLYARDLGVPCVVCGPGSIGDAHRADESVAEDQIGRCEAMLAALRAAL